jgi:hypothetical protein
VIVFAFTVSTSLPRWLPLGRQRRFANPIEYYSHSGTLSIGEVDGSQCACTRIAYIIRLHAATFLIGCLGTCVRGNDAARFSPAALISASGTAAGYNASRMDKSPIGAVT